MPPAIQQIGLPIKGLDRLIAEARAEGYNFIDTLAGDWQSGENRFDGPGEILMGSVDQGQLVAVDGLNRDPFANDPQIARIRRVFVRKDWRGQGLGAALVLALVAEARKNFRSVRLRAENAGAARLYERLGFTPIPNPDATHILHFGQLANPLTS